jgi:hypothetical protein
MCHELMETHARDSVKKHLLPMPLCNFTRRKHSYEANPIVWNSHCESCSCDGAVSQKQRPRGFQGVRLRCIVLVATADCSAVAPRVVCKSKCQREGCVKAYQYNTFRPPWALPFTKKKGQVIFTDRSKCSTGETELGSGGTFDFSYNHAIPPSAPDALLSAAH